MQARCQQGTRKQCGWQMKQPPDRRVPRSNAPADQAPAGSGATRNEAEPGEQTPMSRAAGNRCTDAGHAPRTSLSGRMKHFVPSRLAKATAAVCRGYLLPPPRGLPPHLWSHDMDTFGQTAVNISTPHIACVHTSKSECNHSLTMLETRRI